MNFRAREVEPPPEPDKVENPVLKKKTKKVKPEASLYPLAALKEFEEKEDVTLKVILPQLEDSTATVHSLWEFQCDLTDGRNISCMTWNKVR